MPYINSSGSSGGGHPPGFEIGYDQITANVSVTSTTEATGTTIITCAAHVFDGSPVLVQFNACRIAIPVVTTQNASNSMGICLFEGATQITRLLFALSLENIGAGGVSIQEPVSPLFRFTPTAASHTYTITAFVNSNTGGPAVLAGAGGTATDSPCFVRFTKV